MSWVGIASLIILGCVAVGLAYLLLARHRKKSRGWRSPHPGAAVERSEAEDSAPQAEAKTAHTGEAAEHVGSAPCMAARGEPTASGQQPSDTPDNVKAIAPEVQHARPKKASADEGQRDFTEGLPPGTCGIESELIRQLDKRYEEPKAQGEPLSELPTDNDLKTDVSGSASSTEEVRLPAKEQEPCRDRIEDGEHVGAQLETGEFSVDKANAPTSGADDTEKKTPGGEETAHGTAEEDVQKQPSEAHTERDADRLMSKPDASRQTTEIAPQAGPQKGEPEDSSERGRGAKEKKEQRVTASKKTGEKPQKKSARAVTAADGRPARDRSTAGVEGKPDGVTEQIAVAALAEVQQRRERKSKRKWKRRELPTRTRPEAESVADKPLLTEVPEITESHKAGGDIERERACRLRKPSRYRPPSQEPLPTPQPSAKRRPTLQAPQKTLALTVRLLFDRSGYLRIGLLPQREADLPAEILLGQGENRFRVTDVHDGWYEDVFPENLSELLSVGIAWEGCAESEVLGYWNLSGRDLYVMATHRDLRGFAQETRLKIGREHVLLCRNLLLAEVETVLYQAGCAGFTKLDDSYGAPAGWTVIRGVVPRNVVRVEKGPEILCILQPTPELEIDLQGGIYLNQSTWLSGFPPKIFVSGDMGTEIEVFIDGDKAVAGDDGSFRSKGYDRLGEHRVSIPLANMSKTYRISERDEGWTAWDAYSLMTRVHLCGPLLVAAETTETLRVVVVPASSSVILGAKPGDIAWCAHIHGPKQVGCVTFHPVWTLPCDAFGCDKGTTRILLLDARPLAPAQRHHFSGKEATRVLAWSTAILNASRKGLSVDSSDPNAVVLWREYRAHARSLWKMLKK